MATGTWTRRVLPAPADVSVRQWRLVVGAWVVWWSVAYLRSAGSSWFWFRDGVTLLFDPDGATGGLHLYAAHPALQIGPVSFFVAAPFVRLGSPFGTALAMALMLGCGLAIVRLVRDLIGTDARREAVLRAGILIAIPAWVQLSVGVTHLDDALAVALGVAALRAVQRDRGLLAAVLLALAAGAKPWAAAFVGLLLVLPGPDCRRALGLWAGALAAIWLPFVVADPHTLAAAGFRIANSPTSALRALGITTDQTPTWCRAAQLIGGLALAGLCAVRRRPELVLAAVVAVRLLLDPGTHIYYDAGLLACLLVVDVLAVPIGRYRVPWLTAVAAFALYLPGTFFANGAPPVLEQAFGVARAATMIAVIVVIGVLCARTAPRSSPTGRRSAIHA